MHCFENIKSRKSSKSNNFKGQSEDIVYDSIFGHIGAILGRFILEILQHEQANRYSYHAITTSIRISKLQIPLEIFHIYPQSPAANFDIRSPGG